ncbi:hypothetical protein KSF_110410 [Reticulibacter mediterranei]|uniref:Uncharacterized protein n=1 Tax=Reticulibacter mediterranei TaxID=2778369 RepID=A0A8J3IYS9_9CHLR|nr:hypothetical protein KSF_110410 [Reticulibacter mediterranei]
MLKLLFNNDGCHGLPFLSLSNGVESKQVGVLPFHITHIFLLTAVVECASDMLMHEGHLSV